MTLLAKLKSDPLIATVVPPAALPLTGATPLTVGVDMHRFSNRVSCWVCALMT